MLYLNRHPSIRFFSTDEFVLNRWFKTERQSPLEKQSEVMVSHQAVCTHLNAAIRNSLADFYCSLMSLVCIQVLFKKTVIDLNEY